MKLSSVKKAVSSRLATRLILVVILLISSVSLILTLFFMWRQRELLTQELINRTSSLAHNLAYNTSDILIHENRWMLRSLVSGVEDDHDIVNVFITAADGTVLACSDSVISGQTFVPPGIYHQGGGETWIIDEAENTRRLAVPIEIDVPLIDTASPLCSLSNVSDIWKSIYRLGGLQPNFNHTADEILFTIQIHGSRSQGVASISIAERSVRLLVEPASNGFWSTSGRYLVYNTQKQLPVHLSVLDMVTGEVNVIAQDEGGIYGTSCFTPDDRYIIATLPNANGLHRLFRIPREGGEMEQLTFHPGIHWFPNCSSDGNWIIYSENFHHTLHAYDIRKGTSIRLFPDMEERHWSGSFSPDGKRFCYLRYADNTTNDVDVYVADFPVDYSKPVSEQYGIRITTTGNYKLYTDWAPDGSLITFGQLTHPQRYFEVWIVSPEKGAQPINLSADIETYNKLVGYAVLDITMESVNRAVARGNRIALAISLFFTGIGALCAIVLVRTIVRPVKTLADAAGKVAEGNLDQTVIIKRDDEIGMLAEAFNRMTGRLRESIRKIESHSRDLEKAYHDLESLDRAKDDFLSLVSHELRTPLGSMLLHAEMLLNRRVHSEKKQAHYHETIVNQCKRLARLVDDVLDLSKIEAGRMELALQPFLLRELLSDVYSILLSSLRKKNLRFTYDDVSQDIWLMGDRDKIVEVLTNIVTNAVKFTPQGGGIRVTLATGDGMGTVAVSDTGIGIPADDIPKVFDRFSQLEKVDHHSEGTGLGMTISKSIVELHGGTIWIESEEGKGTTVSFTLPLAESPRGHLGPSRKTDATQSGSELSGKSPSKAALVLIVDDEKSYREAIADCVRNAGYDTLEASNGSEALLLADEAQPSLIILDVMMPDLSGLDVCRLLREKSDTRDIPVIMLSARGQIKEKEEGLAAGADRYITKPFDYDDLILTIDELTGGDA